MTRNKLRNILEKDVGLKVTFRIIECKWDRASIKIFLTQDQEKKLNNLKDQDYRDDNTRSVIDYYRVRKEIENYIGDSVKQLKSKKFRILDLNFNSVEFSYPKEHVVKPQPNDSFDHGQSDVYQKPFWDYMNN